jgi:3-dehydroquinate synthetase
MASILEDFSNYKRNWSVNTSLPVSFQVQYSANIFDTKNHDLISHTTSDRCLVIIDKTVYNLYGDIMRKYFEILKKTLAYYVIDATEENKNWENVDNILKFFEANGVLRRSEPIIAVGGGVLLDLVGFCASIYRRGIPYIKVPTTLLAIVDASVGAKVGANHLDRRNRIGAYYPPVISLLDKKFIATQDERNIINGIAEIFKLALIKDEELFTLLETNADQLINEKFQYGAVPVRVINLAISGMVGELAPNLWEKKLDRCVDFGHSFSPVIEMKNLPDLYHGEAVVLDCLYSSCISHNRGLIDMYTLSRIFYTAFKLKLPTYHVDFSDIPLLKSALNDTMKHRNDNQYLPVPIKIGNYVILNDVTKEELSDAVDMFEEMSNMSKQYE